MYAFVQFALVCFFGYIFYYKVGYFEFSRQENQVVIDLNSLLPYGLLSACFTPSNKGNRVFIDCFHVSGNFR